MRKKYLSALLFGALLFASAGTFTSCKDYDDDINNLQAQITANAQGIEELKSLVENGDYVTNVEKSADGLVITFKNAGTQTITLEDKVGSVVTVNEDGVLCIDGEPTEIKVATSTGEESKDQIIIENNMWSVLQEDGTYKSTNIPVSGVTVSGSEADGYTFTIYENGKEPQTVKLPSATSSLVDIILVDSENINDETQTPTGSALQYQKVGLIQFAEFEYTGDEKWPGKELPADGQVIVAQDEALLVQLNPTNVDGKDIKFGLVDSKKASAGLDLVAADYTDLLTARAANENGLYKLAVKDMIFGNATAANAFYTNFAKNGSQKRYAVKAGNVLSEYNVLCEKATTEIEYDFNVEDASGNNVNAESLDLESTTNTVTAPDNERLEMGQWYTVAADMATIYDLYLSANQDETTLYGIEIKNEDGVYQFRYTKTPDDVSKPEIHITIQSVDKEGNYNSTIATFSLSEVISSAYTYAETAWTLVDFSSNPEDDEFATKNAFTVKMSDMLNSFSAENLALWNTKVQACTFQLYDVETGKVAKDKAGDPIIGLPGGMSVVFADKDNNTLVNAYRAKVVEGETLKELGSAEDIKATTSIRLGFKNNTTLANALSLNHKYKVVITFVGKAPDATGINSVLSTTEIPFTLSIPTIDKLFVEQAGVFINGIANAYMDAEAEANSSKDASYKFASAFNNFGVNMKATTFTFTMDNETKIVDNLTSADLATITDGDDKKAVITLTKKGGTGATSNTPDVDSSTGLHKGYKQELIVNVSAKFAGVWDYGTANDVDYTFKIKVMSPLYEGKIVATDQVVIIPATDTNGHEVNSSDIAGYTYNNILYSIFPDKEADTEGQVDYARKEIQKVEFKSLDENVFTSENSAQPYQPAGDDPEKDPAKNGYLVVRPMNLAETTDAKLKVTLTDAWGYKKVAEIPVRVTVGE
ncbi:PL29 family lyase N-terminal domain-containing protein [Bacteroides ilei]|uniref:PL29 family lyase N-terminal domain-containing protein n=1 Tax=Bacteroides ilei TaxID=1907658 RepID=UPI00092FFBBA|nr:PL29 family lyase N-terminal domain-containing protein [Bacteroides ilei]